MSQYQPDSKKLRLNAENYPVSQWSFITICCTKGKNHFGRIASGKMELNEFGEIAREQWLQLPSIFYNLELDTFQIMPDHMHGIIRLNGPVSFRKNPEHNATKEKVPLTDAAKIPEISKVIGAYKSGVANQCLSSFKNAGNNHVLGKIWHRSFYERIIRDNKALQNIRNYIINNPRNWSGR